MTVGVELAQARERHGLSLESVSHRTKISVERLSAIERGDLAQLPERVYLKGFLRAYAAEVHLDGNDVAQRYLAELDQTGEVECVSSAAPAAGSPAFAPRAVDDPLSEFESEAELQH